MLSFPLFLVSLAFLQPFFAMVKKRAAKTDVVKEGSDANLHETIKALNALIETLREEIAELKKDKAKAERNDFKDKVKDNNKGQDKSNEDDEDQGKDKGKTSFHFSSSSSEWKTVKAKTTPITSATLGPLTLRASDWPLPILTSAELKVVAKSVLFANQAEAEKLYADIKNCRGRMGLNTPRLIEGSGGREIEVIFENMAKRMTRRTCFITTIGDEPEVRALYEKKSVIDACTFKLSNTTKRVVISLQAKYTSKEDFLLAARAPRAALHGWLKENDLHQDLRFVTQLFMKRLEDKEWMEAVATIHEGAVDKYLKASGKSGWFIKPWLDRNEPEDHGTQIIWVGEEVPLSDALSKADRYGEQVRCLAFNKRVLGIRVMAASYKSLLSKILPADSAAEVLRKKGQKIYEVSHVPPWVDAKELREQLINQLPNTFAIGGDGTRRQSFYEPAVLQLMIP